MKRTIGWVRDRIFLLLLVGSVFLAACGDDGSDPSPVLPAPANLSAAPGDGRATFEWGEVTGATTYNLYLALQPGVTRANYTGLTGGTKQTGATRPFTQTGLANGATYYAVVTTVGPTGESGESNEIRITPAPPAPVKAIASGGTHPIALKENDMVWSWGGNGAGQIGDGTTTRRLAPVQVNGLTGISAVGGGLNHTLAVKADGTVSAWGENQFGQLGDGTTTDALYPVAVSGLTDVVQVAGGRHHSIALKSDGTVWSWGGNASGQLGNNGTADSITPVQVTGLTGVTAIAAGAFHSVALRASDGAVWIWGDNRHAQIDNTNLNRLTPVLVTGLTGGTPTAIAAGAFHTVVLRSDGAVWSWGSNGSGQLGHAAAIDPNGNPIDQPVPALVTGLTGIKAIGAGEGHTLAVKQDGTVMAWGDHLFNRNLDGTTIRELSPVPVTGLTGIVQVAGGGFHAVALKDDGSVWTWGDNFTGQLGNGTTADNFIPGQVMSPVS